MIIVQKESEWKGWKLKEICMVGVVHNELNMLASLMVVETSINDSDGYSDGRCDSVMPKIGCDGWPNTSNG